mgnify:CR=1 FL=1
MTAVVNSGQTHGWEQEIYSNALDSLLSMERQELRIGARALNKHFRPWAHQ